MTRNEPIRLLHFADIHIGMENFGTIDPVTGLNTRVLDFLSRLKEIVDYAINNQIDCVLFAGDAFKTRDPNPTYQRGFARQIMRLSRADIPTVLLVGNHDMPVMERRATSVDIYQTLEVPNIVIGEREEVRSYGRQGAGADAGSGAKTGRGTPRRRHRRRAERDRRAYRCDGCGADHQ